MGKRDFREYDFNVCQLSSHIIGFWNKNCIFFPTVFKFVNRKKLRHFHQAPITSLWVCSGVTKSCRKLTPNQHPTDSKCVELFRTRNKPETEIQQQSDSNLLFVPQCLDVRRQKLGATSTNGIAPVVHLFRKYFKIIKEKWLLLQKLLLTKCT